MRTYGDRLSYNETIIIANSTERYMPVVETSTKGASSNSVLASLIFALSVFLGMFSYV